MAEQREPWEWEREHSPFTVEGQIESYGAFSRGLLRGRREIVGRVLLGLAVLCAVIVVIALVT